MMPIATLPPSQQQNNRAYTTQYNINDTLYSINIYMTRTVPTQFTIYSSNNAVGVDIYVNKDLILKCSL